MSFLQRSNFTGSRIFLPRALTVAQSILLSPCWVPSPVTDTCTRVPIQSENMIATHGWRDINSRSIKFRSPHRRVDSNNITIYFKRSSIFHVVLRRWARSQTNNVHHCWHKLVSPLQTPVFRENHSDGYNPFGNKCRFIVVFLEFINQY